MAIHLHAEDVSINFIKGRQLLKKWLAFSASKEGFKTGTLNYIFCSDDYLIKINIQFLDHNTYTDIITFDYTENKTVNGDIYISIDRIRENAGKYGVSTEDELRRVMVHGLMHLCGYKDKKPKDKALMTSKEDFYLKKFKP